MSGSALEIGNAETTEIGFLLKNYDGAWNAYSFQGADLTVNLTIGAETLKVGVFTIDTQPKSSGALQIKALDNMVKFNQPYTTALTDGATLLQILQDACTTCGVTLATTTFTNSTYAAKIPTEDTTFHAVVAWVAQLAGKVAWFDEDGELNLSWYGATGFNITPNYRFEGFEHEESDITITGVVYRDENGDVTAGTSGYAFIIEGNPLLDPGDASTVVTAIYGAVGGFSYRPYAGDTLGYPHLWPLDGVTITLVDGVSTAYSIITNHRYVLNSTSQISALGETEQFYGYTPPADLLPAQKTYIQNSAISAAQTAANGKNTIYYSPTQPTGGTYIPGDTWFDTDDDNRVYKHDGSAWIAVQFGENAIADLNITREKIADSAVDTTKLADEAITQEKVAVGAITADHIQDGSITGDKIAAGAIKETQVNWSTHLLF